MNGRVYGPITRRLQAAVTGAHGLVYRASGGRLLGGLGANRVVVLTTTGRRSGEPRTIPLFGYADGDDYIVVASNGGSAGHPAWFLNLRANPNATLRIKGRDIAVRASELPADQRDEWWPRVVRNYRFYDSYQNATDRKIPMVRLTPTRQAV